MKWIYYLKHEGFELQEEKLSYPNSVGSYKLCGLSFWSLFKSDME